MPDRRSLWTAYTGLLLLVAWACFGSLRHHSIYFHDDETFRDNEAMTRDATFFFSGQCEHQPGRPVAALVKWATFGVTGNQPGPAHLVVVAFHLAASLALAAASARLGLSLPASQLAGFLFLVEVAHFQAVHHISALDFQLALLLGLVAWCCDRRQRRAGGWGWTAATALALIAAAACHLGAVALWPVLVVDRWHGGDDPRHALWRQLPAGAALAAATFLLLRATPADTTTWASLQAAPDSLAQTALGAGRMLAWMAARLATTAHWLPVILHVVSRLELALGAALLAGLAWLALRRGRPTAPWAAWTGLTLAPFALISERITTEGLEGPSHYLYLASAGACVLLARGVELGAARLDGYRRPWGRVAALVAVALLAASSWQTLKRVESLSWFNSARYLFQTDAAASVAFMRRAIDGGDGVIPVHEAYLRLAIAQPLAGQDPYPTLREAAQRFPGSFYVQGAIAIRELESADADAQERGRQRLAEALAQARQVGQGDRFGTNVAALCHNLGGAYERGGDPARAARVYARALPLNPEPAKTRARLANAYRLLAEGYEAAGRTEPAAQARRLAAEAEAGAP